VNIVGSIAVDLKADRRSRASSKGRVAAEHGDARAILGTAKRDHVLANMGGDKIAVVGATVGQNVLHKIVSELITSNCITSIKVQKTTAERTYCRSRACADDPDDLRRPSQGSDQGTRCHRS
jgi:hypothetical protein